MRLLSACQPRHDFERHRVLARDRRRVFTRLAIAAACLLGAGPPVVVHASDEQPSPRPPVPVAEWLVLGPVPAPLPAFHADSRGGFKVEDLLAVATLAPALIAPRDGASVVLPAGEVAWRRASGHEISLAWSPADSTAAEAYLAVWLRADRWLSAELSLDSPHPAAILLDGEIMTLKTATAGSSQQTGAPSDGAAAAAGATPATAEPPSPKTARTASLELAPGKHLLVVRTIRDPGKGEPWRLAADMKVGSDFPIEALTATLDPTRAQNIHDVLEAPAITSTAISPDGKLVACSVSCLNRAAERESWLEIRAVADGRLVQTWRGALQVSGVSWAPTGTRLSFLTGRDDKTTIWLYDLATGQATPLVRDVERHNQYQWSPDGRFIAYSFRTEVEPDKRKVKRLQGLEDRQPDWRSREYLMLATVPDGAIRRLTAGEWSAEGWEISPDGKHLLFFREQPEYSERPYAKRELWELDFSSHRLEMVLADRWIDAAEYGPQPQQLVLKGAPSALDGLGRDLPPDVVPNDYGGQLYLYDRRTRRAQPLTREFDPDVQRFAVGRHDGRIYAQVVERQVQNLYALDLRARGWTRLDTGFEISGAFDLALAAPAAVVLCEGATTPQRLVAIDLRSGRARTLLEPAREAYRSVAFGRVEDWTCTLPSGETLDGRVYYPLGYDPAKKYPAIVNYYGGTSPVGRDFAGRYPKNVWAGLGYFVYVPQPSGALGYGQAFAARHVNDWGIRTADEVIEGTRAFLAAFPNVDPKRVGCIGASYGGFLTELILTRTDMFAAAVSHAGISSIASYWGEGLWGYNYGARALANAFPWSHRDLYVGQSPLYSADRITTPLLLLHGSDDTNVPPGESDQLYTALKLLGRDVEYIRVEGQNHHVLDPKQRVVWNDTILAYLAKYLKGEVEWWAKMYPQ